MTERTVRTREGTQGVVRRATFHAVTQVHQPGGVRAVLDEEAAAQGTEAQPEGGCRTVLSEAPVARRGPRPRRREPALPGAAAVLAFVVAESAAPRTPPSREPAAGGVLAGGRALAVWRVRG